MRQRRLLVLVVTVIAVVTTLGLLRGVPYDRPAIDQTPTGRGGHTDRFRVTVSDIAGLFPGGHQPLRVLFTNDHPFDIWVTEVTLSAQDTPRCPAEHLVTGTYQLRDRIHVPGRSRAAGEIRFGMRASAPNGCRGVSFDLEVRAKAVKR